MIDSELRALKRLLKKLSAVRQVLRNDEREWLDRFVTGESDEVTAHMFTPGKGKRAQPVIELDSKSSYIILEEKRG